MIIHRTETVRYSEKDRHSALVELEWLKYNAKVREGRKTVSREGEPVSIQLFYEFDIPDGAPLSADLPGREYVT